MIQRIQTIHLLLAIASAVLYLISPYGYLNSDIALVAKNSPVHTVLTLASILLSITTIIKFKNRKLQKKLIWVGFGVVDFLIVVLIYQYFFSEFTKSFTPGLGLIFIVFIPIFLALAMRGINNDEKLIKSMDRLR